MPQACLLIGCCVNVTVSQYNTTRVSVGFLEGNRHRMLICVQDQAVECQHVFLNRRNSLVVIESISCALRREEAVRQVWESSSP